jgi:oxygen-independent coproporphyrinogen III oxidase
MRTALYVHFPFCVRKCQYCDFNSEAVAGTRPEEYVALLLREMELRRQALAEPAVSPTLYFGGGTPSLMSPDSVARIIDKAAAGYGLQGDAEVTLEANPGTVTAERLASYRLAGVNRLSLGIQSFEDRLLSRLGRVHSVAEAVTAYQLARQAGFDNISIDLMHSLPGQSLSQWREALSRAIELAPEHISAYALSIEEGTPFQALAESGELPLPEEEEAARMFELTDELLSQAGYLHYEISNFARPGRESRHNNAYWRRDSYLGFGAGAHSFLNHDRYGRRWSNLCDIRSYCDSIGRGILPEEEGESLTLEDAVSEAFFLGLRMLDGIDLSRLRSQFPQQALAPHLAEVARLERSGALVRNGDRVRLAPRSVIVANSVFSRFLRSPADSQ